MFCHNCGGEIPDSSLFCSKCGAKVVGEPGPEVNVLAADSEPGKAEPAVDTPAAPSAPAGPEEPKEASPKKSKGGCLALVIILVIAIISVKGCLKGDTPATDSTGTPSNAQPSGTTSSSDQAPSPQTPATTNTGKSAAANTMPGVGDTQQTKAWNVTLNEVYVTRTINQQNNEFLIARAGAGEIFLVVDVTFENRTKQTQSFSSLLESPKIITGDGYEYTYDFEGAIALKNAFEDGDVTPGLKKRGEWAFKIRDDSSDLYFAIEFFSKTYTWFLCNELPDM